jgi:hypothetical protein
MRITPRPDVLVREVSGESVLLNLKNETYYGLDDIGTRMWAVLTDSGTIQDAFHTLLAEYDVTEDTLRGDLDDFIGKLVEQGLVELHGE